jgi:tetratricopeptide (TPR) repeat protein
MHRLGLLSLLVIVACEEPQQAETRKKVERVIDLTAEGRAELLKGDPQRAIALFKRAISATPEDASLYLLLAEAYQAAGNEAGATLTLKQAENVQGVRDPGIRRQRAELLLKMRQTRAAIVELSALRDEDLLSDSEILELSRLLAHAGRIDEAFKTIERIQLRNPDDPEAKTMEAEILFLRGDVMVAAKVIDRLLGENPALTSARVLRARYFLNEKELSAAEQDLAMIDPKDARRPDVVALRARVLNELDRLDESVALLERLLEDDPRDSETLAILAETKLLQGRGAEAQELVERILSREPRWARALYVRGRSLELQGRFEEALIDYEAALRSDSTFAPVLSRLWRIHDRKGNKPEAIATLEQLFFQNDITADEKVQLARYYAETWANVERGQKLIDEALRKDPKNPEYLKIRARLKAGAAGKAPSKRGNPGGIEIIKRRGR